MAVYLETERLIIRDPKWEDMDGHHLMLSDELTLTYWSDIGSRHFEDNRRNLEAAIADVTNTNREKYFFTMELKESQDFVGTVGYTVTEVTPVGKIVGIGYATSPNHRGQGYTLEALREVIRFAFEENGVYRIYTGCLTENEASERIMQKCGMIKEAEFKCHTWHKGQMKDRVEYRILKEEYILKFI
ncbi:MAG: GNAT family N-acetyltransferase [Defluviitaleaceae bacterium]|nr:GNAT family N-acetyltransferase [Defluviitaleaceae bacterium]